MGLSYYKDKGYIKCINTVEPPNKGHVGTRSFVLYREVSLIRRLKCTGIIGIGTSRFVLYREVFFIQCPLSEVPLYNVMYRGFVQEHVESERLEHESDCCLGKRKLFLRKMICFQFSYRWFVVSRHMCTINYCASLQLTSKGKKYIEDTRSVTGK